MSVGPRHDDRRRRMLRLQREGALDAQHQSRRRRSARPGSRFERARRPLELDRPGMPGERAPTIAGQSATSLFRRAPARQRRGDESGREFSQRLGAAPARASSSPRPEVQTWGMRSTHERQCSAPASEAKRKAIVARMLAWWDRIRRTLALARRNRGRARSLSVWLSEILLQQTTAQAATPYYQAFPDRWPTSRSWQRRRSRNHARLRGLGYYSRARNCTPAPWKSPDAAGLSERGGGTARASRGRRLYRGGDRRDRLRRDGRRLSTAISPVFWRASCVDTPSLAGRAELAEAARRWRQPEGGRFRPSADGYRLDALPPRIPTAASARSRRLRRVPSRRPRGLPAPPGGEDQAAPAGALCSSPDVPTAPSSRAAGRLVAFWLQPSSCRGRYGLAKAPMKDLLPPLRSSRAGGGCRATWNRFSPISR